MAPLHLLIVEDQPTDAELIVRELKNSGYDPAWERVDTSAAFERRLAEHQPDLIISDHSIPHFGSWEALRQVRRSGLDIPFIVVSQAIGEEEAVSLLRSGAADYLMKDRLGRLGEAVRQALEQRRLQKERDEAQQAIVTLNADLERRIAERTVELQTVNRNLELELEQRTRAEDALSRLNSELEQRIKERTRDVVATHHQLRAMASELTLTEQRERKRLAAEMHDYLAQMLALGRIKIGQLRQRLDTAPAAQPLAREIDGVFDQALTYTRTLMAKLGPPVLDELGLPAALTWLAEQMPLHNLAVEVRLESDQVPLPDDQAILLFQSVRELLINVAKHSGADQATVTLRIEDHNRLCIEVQDSGKGFDPRALDAKSAGEHFGLLCVRERMEAMNGWVSVNSAVGQGTTVCLALSLAGSPESKVLSPEESGSNSALPSRSALHQQDTKAIRVLLVDDHAMVRQGLRTVLDSYADIEVVGEARDGEEAVAATEAFHPAVVLMDINMPEMNGIEATAHIKARHPEIIVIGLSVNTSGENERAMKQAGAAMLLTKEAAVDELYQAMQEALGSAGKR